MVGDVLEVFRLWKGVDTVSWSCKVGGNCMLELSSKNDIMVLTYT